MMRTKTSARAIALGAVLFLAASAAWAEQTCELAPVWASALATKTAFTPQGQAELNRLRTGISNLLTMHGRLLEVSITKPGLKVCADSEVDAHVKSGENFIFVSTGLLKMLGEDAELMAGVIAHEMGHLDRGHASYYRNAMPTYLAYGRAVAVDEYRKTGDRAGAINKARKAFLQYERAFKREQELDADDFATQLLTRAGFKAEAIVKLMLRFLQYDGYAKTIWFQTHPGWIDRIARVEPRVYDEEINQTAKRLADRGDAKALAEHIDNWLKQLPDSGNAWFHKGAFLERLREISYLEAYERSVDSSRQPSISKPEGELYEVWLTLCVGLYHSGFKLESAHCSRYIRDYDTYERYKEATFGERLFIHGEPSTSTLLTTLDESGSKLFTNQPSTIRLRGGKAQQVVPWRPIRFPPTDADQPLAGR